MERHASSKERFHELTSANRIISGFDALCSQRTIEIFTGGVLAIASLESFNIAFFAVSYCLLIGAYLEVFEWEGKFAHLTSVSCFALILLQMILNLALLTQTPGLVPLVFTVHFQEVLKMRILISKVCLVGLVLLMVLACPSQATTHVWITINPPSSQPTPSSTFTTYLNVSTWNGVVGALDVTVCYDPAVLHIINFSTPSDSPFYPNCFADTDSFTSGKTKIAGFQVTDREMWKTPVPLGIITWQVVGTGSETSETDITIKPNSVVDANWSRVKVMTYGQHISIFSEEVIFDIGSPFNPYPSIAGAHKGTITPNKTIFATKLYTYPCEGTGGHTEYARIWNATWEANATWEGYAGEWHNISFDKTVVLLAGETYFYEIRTGSYPQIHHTNALLTANGWINCTEFKDTNGRVYYDWIPAIKLF